MSDGIRETGERQALLETWLQNAPVGFAFLDRHFRYVRLNDALAAAHTMPADDAVGKTVQEVVPYLWPLLEPFLRRALAGETLLDQDISVVTQAGDRRCWRSSLYPVRREGDVVGIGVVVIDVTEQRRAEAALRVRKDLYAMLSRTNRAVAVCATRDALFQELCATAVESGRFLFAWVGELRGDRVERVASAGDDKGYLAELVISLEESDPRSRGPCGRCALTGRSVVVNEFMATPAMEMWHASGARVGIEAVASFPLSEQGRVVAVLSLYAGAPGFFTEDRLTTLNEITPSASHALDAFVHERKREHDEAELRTRDRALRAVSQGIIIADARAHDEPIIYASPSFARITGYAVEEALGRNCRFLQGKDTDPKAIAEVSRAVRAGRACTVEILNYRKDGTPFWNTLDLSPVLDAGGAVTHFVGVQTDLTERRNLESQLRQAQKMEAVGQLAAGVAHDFNNLLSVILSYTSLVEEALPAGDPSRTDLEEVRLAAKRATELTRQLLAFSRQQTLQPRVLELGQVVLGMEKMLRRLLGEDVELSLSGPRPFGRVHADPSQVEQTLMNLAVNARDAMTTGGTLSIETVDVDVGASHPAAERHGVPPGAYVMLAISDTGEGMDAATRERIFEPFFTTKELGKGTGLGLSTVFGIVTQSQGHITVESEPGRGTTFAVYLPRVEGAAEQLPAPANPGTLRGTETILLVEDEEQVRTMMRSVLRRHGYTVLDAQNGGEAFLICEQYEATIHLLLSDVVMPRMSGRQLAERLRPLRPDMRALFVSGYTGGALSTSRVLGPQVAFLPKPFTPDTLLRRVRELLDEPPAAAEPPPTA
jgi:PAS domain S-box-containing protein